MRLSILLTSILCLLLLSNVSIYAQVKVTKSGTAKISLAEAKRFAVNNNFKVRSLIQKVEAAKAGKNKTRSSFYPKFGIAGGADHESSGDVSETAPVGFAYANFNLFNGFKDVYDSEIADLSTEKARVELQREKFRVELDTEEQFHLFLYFQDLIRVKNQALSLNAQHQKLVKRTKSMGQASKTDVMEFELKESVIKSELVSLRQGLEKARIHLRRLLGEEVGSQIEPVGELQHQHIDGQLMSYLDQIKENSIPIKLASKEHAIASLNSKKWRSKWLPSIDFQAQAGLLDLDSRPEGTDSTDSAVSFQLIAKVELFSGMRTHWEKKETEALRKSASSELKHEILSSITEMEESFRELKAIEERVDLELGNEELSNKYYKSVKKEYERGYKNSADLSGAADGLFETKTRQINFKFDFLKQRLAFERSYGAPIKVVVIDEKSNNKQKGR